MTAWGDFEAPRRWTDMGQVLASRAGEGPDRPAFTFLADGEREAAAWTYAELDGYTWAVAERLLADLRPGSRALLLYPSGLDFIAALFGCFRAGIIAVPARFSGSSSMAGLAAILNDCGAAAVLTTTNQAAGLQRSLGQITVTERPLLWVATDRLAFPNRPPTSRAPAGDDIALLQYTSGSTAAPKGVMVTHGNILSNQAMIQAAFGHDQSSTFVNWLPFFHDMGLMGNLIQPVYLGAHCVLMPPLQFLRSPVRWLRAIERFEAHTSGGPNFAYDLCVDRIEPAVIRTLDLSRWRVAFNGAEPIRAATLERFGEAFAAAGFRASQWFPCYGLAEAALFVAGGPKSSPPRVRRYDRRALERHRITRRTVSGETGSAEEVRLVAVGRAAPGQRIRIVGRSGAPCGEGEVGEVWIAGPHVAGGYWNQEAEARLTFRRTLTDEEGTAYLSTGDLGFLDDGELFITGRADDLIVLRGCNHNPEEIEQTMGWAHPALQPGLGAAFVVEGGSGPGLALVQELRRGKPGEPLDDALKAVRHAVAEAHGLTPEVLVLIRAGSLPRTSSGKVQRRRCKRKLLEHGLPVVARSGETDGELRPPAAGATAGEEPSAAVRRLAAQCLGIATEEVEPGRSLIALGFDSFRATLLAVGVERELGRRIAVERLLELESLAGVAALLEEEPAEPPMSPAVEDGAFPLSDGQRAFWYLNRLRLDSTTHLVRGAGRLREPLRWEALARALDVLALRHPMLRTVFTMENGQPVQRTATKALHELHLVDASALSESELLEQARSEAGRAFDLQRGGAFRVIVLSRRADDHAVVLSLHHAIADYWSLGLLVQELSLLYQAETAGSAVTLPPVHTSYAESVRREAERAGVAGEARVAAYLESLELDRYGPPLELPFDLPRPPMMSARAGSVQLELGDGETRALKELAEREAVTLYMLLMAAFQILLHRYTGQPSFLIGSPVWGVRDAAMAEVVGCFVNTVVVAADVGGRPSLSELLARVRQRVLCSLAFSDVPYARLVERARPSRDLSAPTLVSVLFTFQNAPSLGDIGLTAFALGIPGIRLRLPGLPLESISLPREHVEFDLDLSLGEVDGTIRGYLAYNADIFAADAAGRMAEHLGRILRALPHASAVADIDLLSEEERRWLLGGCNGGSLGEPETPSIHRRFEVQARQTPDAVALVAGPRHISYRRLAGAADVLAAILLRLHRGAPAPPVALLTGAAPEFAMALFAVLKAGAGFLPLEPDYPVDRLAFMIDDCGVRILVTRRALAEHAAVLAESGAALTHLVILDDEAAGAPEVRALPATVGAPSAGRSAGPWGEAPAGLVYVVYTSGTTGFPKGVAITHQNLAPLLDWEREHFRIGRGDSLLQTLSVAFDFGLQEWLTMLLLGGELHCPGDEVRRDPRRYLDYIEAHGIRVIFATPSLCEGLMGYEGDLVSLRLILLGGEALYASHIRRLHPRLDPRCAVFNGYGPTEAAINCAMYEVERAAYLDAPSQGLIPIGTASGHSRLYVLDGDGGLLPVGIPGELYIGGPGVAAGYLDRTDLTAERFLPDPFGSDPAARLYRTGDRTRVRAGGLLEFLGRVDQQIKVRGHRVELAEIEAVLRQHPAVGQAAVVLDKSSGGDILWAFVTGRGEEVPTAGGLKDWVAGRLPRFMVPAAIEAVAELPVTRNGKVDRSALLRWARQPALDDLSAAQSSPTERMIARIWRRHLPERKIAFTDSFFEVGGNSLLLMQVHSDLLEATGLGIPIARLLEHASIAALASYLDGLDAAEVGSASLTQRIEGQRRAVGRMRQRLQDGRRRP